MALNSTVPWKMNLTGTGSGRPKKHSWWARWRDRAGRKAHPTLMKEQDLDHLGALHDTLLHTKKR
ncbi:MAG: hypothetical protein ACO20W_10010 [Anaerohalosphaeraceae bacterium]